MTAAVFLTLRIMDFPSFEGSECGDHECGCGYPFDFSLHGRRTGSQPPCRRLLHSALIAR